MEQFVMEFLDIQRMIEALRTRPMDFEWDRGWLHHLPSNHRFKIDEEGDVRIEALCDCAILRVRRDQGRELWNAVQTWGAAYWRPIEINREFARHFGTPNWLQRIYRRSRVMLRRVLRYHDNLFGPGQSPLRTSPNLDPASLPFLSGTARVRARARLRREAHSVSASKSRK